MSKMNNIIIIHNKGPMKNVAKKRKKRNNISKAEKL